MKKIFRKLMVYAVIFLCGFGINALTGIIVRMIPGLFINMYEIGETGKIIIDLSHLFLIILCYLVIYYKFFIATKNNENLFSQQLSDNFDLKALFNNHMRTVGKNEIIIFAAYSLPLMIFFNRFEMFYTDMRVIGYILGVLLFSAGYMLCSAGVYRKWDKKWRGEEIKNGVKA